MISFGKWPRVLFASVLAMSLWTFISVNTNIFSVDGKFDGFMYFTSYILAVSYTHLDVYKRQIMFRLKYVETFFLFDNRL